MEDGRSWHEIAVTAIDAGVGVVCDGVVVHANAALARLLGEPVDRLVGMTLEEVLARSEDPTGAVATVDRSVTEQVLRSGQLSRVVRRIRRPGDGEVWVVATGQPTDYEGRPGVVFTLTDVTAEHQALLLAEASEHRLQQILDAIDASVFTKDRAGRYTFVNRAFEQEVGRPAADVLGRTAADLAPELELAAAARADGAAVVDIAGMGRQEERLYATGEPVTDVLTRGDRSYLTTQRALRDPSSQIEGMVGVSTNISEQVRAAESQAIATAVLESTSDGIITFDRELVVTRINSSAARYHPLPATQLVGRPFFEVFDAGPQRTTIEAQLRAVLDGAVLDIEFTPAAGDPTRIYAVWAFPIRRADGTILGGALMSRDVTEAQAAEAVHRDLERQVEHMQRLEGLGQLAGGVAHDFNNLLGAIGLTAEMLSSQLPDGSDERAQAATIVEITRRASAFTQQLLVFARKDTARLQRVDLNAAVRRADALLARTLGEHIERHLELAPGQVFVDADPARLEQVVLNLAINARDAMPDGGSVHVATTLVELTADEHATFRTRAPGPHVVLSVTDDGTGMDAATLRQAFDPFFTTKAPGQGTGLGLSTVYGVASQAGGGAWLYSEPGRGTVVKVALPVVGAPTPAAAAPEADPPYGTGQRVAVVEDEAALREVARRILGRAGYQVDTYPEGPALLAALEASGEPPDLLLSDVVLPRLSGPDLAETLLRRHPGVRVLFMSGYTAGLVDGDLPLGAVLDKPFTATTLLSAVSAALRAGTPAP